MQHPSNVLINVKDLHGLALNLQINLLAFWAEQRQHWQTRLAPTYIPPSAPMGPIPIVPPPLSSLPISPTNKGKAIVTEGFDCSDLARAIDGCVEAKAHVSRLQHLIQRLRKQRRRLCFWM